MLPEFKISLEEIKKEILDSPPKHLLSLTDFLADGDVVNIEPSRELLELIEYIDDERSYFNYDRENEVKDWKKYIIKIPATLNSFILGTKSGYSTQKFLIYLLRKNIINNLYIPPSIKIHKDKNKYSFEIITRHDFGAEIALREVLRNPKKFNESVASFKFNDWNTYLKIREEFLGKIIKRQIENIKPSLLKSFRQLFYNFYNEYEFALKKDDGKQLKLRKNELIINCDPKPEEYIIENFLSSLKDWGIAEKYEIDNENLYLSLTKFKDDLKEKIGIYQKGFDSSEEKIEERNSKPNLSLMPKVFYNDKTGIGFNESKRFKFKNHQPEFRVFAEMYKSIGNPVLRAKVLEIGKCEDIGEDKRTYFINELAKKMRKRTGLTSDNLVNNNGDLTLVAEITENAPK